MKDIDIECWLRDCMWCPSPLSDIEMQLDYHLVRQQNMLIVSVRMRNGRLRPVGPVPPSVFNKLRYLHEAGAEIDVHVLNSAPDRRLVYASIFVDGEHAEEMQSRIQTIRSREREHRRQRKAQIEAAAQQRAAAIHRRKQRRKAAFLWSFRMIGRGASAAWAMAFKRAS